MRLIAGILALVFSATVVPEADGQVAVIPLRGQVGIVLREDEPSTGSFDSRYVDQAIRHATQQGAKTVILEIDSPAGYACERNAVCDVLPIGSRNLARHQQHEVDSMHHHWPVLTHPAVAGLNPPDDTRRTVQPLEQAVAVRKKPLRSGRTSVSVMQATEYGLGNNSASLRRFRSHHWPPLNSVTSQ